MVTFTLAIALAGLAWCRTGSIDLTGYRGWFTRADANNASLPLRSLHAH